MTSFPETSSFSNHYSIPSLMEINEETGDAGIKHSNNQSLKSNHSLQSVQLTSNTSPMDYRQLLMLKRNSTRKAWQLSDTEDSDDTNSDSDCDLTTDASAMGPQYANLLLGSNSCETTLVNSLPDEDEVVCNDELNELKNTDSTENLILLKITIPDQTLTKCLRLDPSVSVWSAKQKICRSLAKKLPDYLNYGLFCKQSGFFLLEQKTISYYVNSKSIGNYELRYKSRVYKHISGGESRRLSKMQGESKRKELMRYVRQHNVDKISRMLSKGLDPNFHSSPTGETPLTSVIANFVPGVSESMAFEQVSLPLIRALILGGAHIDFRNQHGFTPLHVAVRNGNIQAVKVLLSLGAPVDSYDNSELTPLYHCSMSNSSADCIRPLYEAGANVQCVNSQKWTILHQVCRHGRIAHLEVIMDIINSHKETEALLNMQNESGNTALHVSAVYGYQQCLLTLLKHGIDKSIRNYSHQDAFQVAIVARNMNVANLIKDYSDLSEQEIALLMQQHGNERSKLTGDKSIIRRHTISAASTKNSHASHKSRFGKHQKETSTVRNKDIGPPRPSIISVSTSPYNEAISMGQTQSYSVEKNQDLGRFTNARNDESLLQPEGMPSLDQQTVHSSSDSASDKSAKSVDAGPSLPIEMLSEFNDVHLQPTSHPDVFHYYRDVSISKGNEGYGFILRGAKADKSIENFSATARHPGLQYLESVEVGSNAHRVGLRSGDFILKINAIDVTSMGHRQTVDVIRKLRDPIRMRVVSVVIKPSESAADEPKNSVKSSSSVSSSPNSIGRNFPRTESIGSAIGKLDSVLESACKEENDETTATLRRRPVSRIFRSQDIEEIFRGDHPPSPSQQSRKRDSRASVTSISSRLVRVLPPTIPTSDRSTGDSSDEVSQNGQINQQKSDKFNTFSGFSATSNSADSRRAPPLPPERRDSRLSNNETNSFPRQLPSPIASQSAGMFAAPPIGRADMTNVASAVAAKAQQRRELSNFNDREKLASTPITHHLVSKGHPPPSVARKPERDKMNPLPQIPDTSEEPKSAFAIALAAKQASLLHRTQPVPASSNHTGQSSSKSSHIELRSNKQYPPPPVSSTDGINPILHNLPPPPPPSAQMVESFDPSSLPPPPDNILPPPAKYTSVSKLNKHKDASLPFHSSKFNDHATSASSNGLDSGSSADSGVDELTSRHRHQHGFDSKSNVDNVSVVSSLSTISSEDGSDAGVSLSFDPKTNSSDQPTQGNMYLDVLKKNRSHSAGGHSHSNAPAGTYGVQLTKVSFSGQKPGFKPQVNASVQESKKIAPPEHVKKTPSIAKEAKPNLSNKQTKPLTEWSVEDVCNWLKELGMASYTDVFAENEIVGSNLPDLTKDELQELGVTRVGHRLTIERSIKKLTGK